MPKAVKKVYNGNYRTEDLDLDDPAVRHQLDNSLPAPEPVEPEPEPDDSDKAQDLAPNPQAIVDEGNWKQRYGDLRAYSQRREKEWNDRISALEDQLKSATTKEIYFPKNDSELEEWYKQFPDVAALVETIAKKQAKQLFDAANERLSSVEQMRKEVERDRALNQIRAKHSDFDDLKEDSKFHEWAGQQPQWIKDALYVNETDPYSVIRAIDLFKFDTRPTPRQEAPKPMQDNRQAALAVRNSNKPNITDAPGGRDIKWSESRVAKLSRREFDKYSDEIDEAREKGEFIYDVSGAAR